VGGKAVIGETRLRHLARCIIELAMEDRVTFIWTIVAAFITTIIGLVVSHAVDARWITPLVMFAAMVGLVSYGRIRRKVRALRERD